MAVFVFPFIPEYGGFNTRSLLPKDVNGKQAIYKGQWSLIQFRKMFPSAWLSNESALDKHLQQVYENYWNPDVKVAS